MVRNTAMTVGVAPLEEKEKIREIFVPIEESKDAVWS